MRTGLILGALLSTMMIGGTALAERSDADNTKGRQIKEQVLEKQKEGFGKSSKASTTSKSNLKERTVREGRGRPKGDVYGDQAARSTGKTQASRDSGRNMSASGRINTPAEIKAMLRMINPMLGAYRTSQAADGTDSYGGNSPVSSPIPNGRSSNGSTRSKNMSATGKINTPSEVKQFLAMIAPMHGAYRTSQAQDGTDSYGGKSMTPQAYGLSDRATTNVHFKNNRGEVTNSVKGNTATAMKNREMRDRMVGMLKAKMARANKAEGK